MNSEHSNGPSANELRVYACRLLGRREYSAAELEQRLRRKWPGLDTHVIACLLHTLVEENLVSDERFTESFVRSQRQRCQGPLKIRATLRARGVADAVIAAELGHGDEAWIDLASRWLERQHPGPLDFDTRKKYYRRLVNRGFTHDQAMSALNRHPDGDRDTL